MFDFSFFRYCDLISFQKFSKPLTKGLEWFDKRDQFFLCPNGKKIEKHDQGRHDFCQDVRGNNIAACTYFLHGNLHIPRDQITVVTLYFVVTNGILNRLAHM